jgi:hypothetical protein
MTAHAIVGVVALACVAVCGMIVAFAAFEMMDKVNDRLPREQQFDPLGWYLPKYQRLQIEYRRLYPNGRLVAKTRVAMALGFASLLVAAWGLGFFALLNR